MPEKPIVFLKPASSIVQQPDSIIHPVESKLIHFELELGVVIGKTAKDVKRSDAMDYVKGWLAVTRILLIFMALSLL